MHLKSLMEGRKKKILAIEVGGKCFVTTFIEDQILAEQQKIMRLLKQYADLGVITNREKFRLVSDGIFEFKSYQMRIHCFFAPNNQVICTHGFVKKQDKCPPEQLLRAKQLRDQYYRECAHD